MGQAAAQCAVCRGASVVPHVKNAPLHRDRHPVPGNRLTPPLVSRKALLRTLTQGAGRPTRWRASREQSTATNQARNSSARGANHGAAAYTFGPPDGGIVRLLVLLNNKKRRISVTSLVFSYRTAAAAGPRQGSAESHTGTVIARRSS